MVERLSLSDPAGRWVLSVAVLGSAMGFLDATVVNVAMPRIGAELGADVAGLQWTLNGYLVALASLLLFGGALGDRFGRRRIFRIGVAWFTVASLACALAPTVEILIATRVLQGIGGALVTPGSLAIIETTFRADQRARTIGWWSALAGLATAAGPPLGGFLVDTLSWRWIFLINLPVGAFVVATAGRMPETRDPKATGRLDLPGATLASTGLAALTFLLIEAPLRGMGAATLLALGTAIVCLAAFVAVESRAPRPILPLNLFSSTQFTVANLLTLVVYAALGGGLFMLTVFLQGAMGYSPLAAGAATLPIDALMLGLSSRMGQLAQRIGPRIPLTAGPLLMAAGTLLLAALEPGDGYLTGVLPALTVFGLGLATVVAPITATVLAAADERHSGIASGVNNAVSRVAQLLAVAVLPAAAGLSGDEYRQPDALTTGFHTALVITAVLAALGGLLAAAAIRPEVRADHNVIHARR
jgi:EmrB/QacA subfamily drug resistance transporter